MQDSATTPDYDEVRISTTVRSADWVATEYNNQSSLGSFYALQAETTQSVTPNASNLIPRTESTIHICGLMQRRYHVVDAQWLSWLAYLYWPLHGSGRSCEPAVGHHHSNESAPDSECLRVMRRVTLMPPSRGQRHAIEPATPSESQSRNCSRRWSPTVLEPAGQLERQPCREWVRSMAFGAYTAPLGHLRSPQQCDRHRGEPRRISNQVRLPRP